MTTPTFKPLSAALSDPRSPWQTMDQLRWAFRRRHENGLADAFRREGAKKILVSPERAQELLAQQPAA
jgi:hypothetical protein